MADYGIKVSKAGYDVATATPDQLVFSSKYQSLKVNSTGSGTITDSGGRTATIAHNLSYVPMFIVHTTIDAMFASAYGDTDDYFISPYRRSVGGCFVDRNIIVYADSTNLYIKLRSDFGWIHWLTGCLDENYADESDGPYATGVAYVGEWDGSEDGALRFTNVALDNSESIYKATLGFYVNTRGGSDDVKIITSGIDEDNTLPFDEGTQAFSRTKTTASDTAQFSASAGDTVGINVKSIVEEIIARGSWANGNAMGFILEDNGTVANTYFGEGSASCAAGCSSSYLKVMKSDTLLNYKYTIYSNEINP